MANQRFSALSRICLNNWHYIQHKTLSFHQGINFFTGHSGSGKSTVIDAMQIVLYANTDGRGFFNKAAADDSDRSLVEYLRGMINIGEDNRFSYLRNQNFSSTIVLEFQRTDTGERQCVGVVFDVETAGNHVARMFFWHKGAIPEQCYRGDGEGKDRTMSVEEVKVWLLRNFSKEDCYFGSHNERFRRQLYDIYLGGLDGEKFPLLFKRAIPFRMNIKLEEFVKEYICMEQDIHMEDMQLSVMEYGRMRRKIEDTCREIEQLKEICGQYETVKELDRGIQAAQYYTKKLEILQDRLVVSESQEKIHVFQDNYEKTVREMEEGDVRIREMNEKSEELLRRISMTGYEQLRQQLAALNALVERLAGSRAHWQQTAEGLKAWEEEDCVSNRTLWDIQAFEDGSITQEALGRLQADLREIRQDIGRQQQEAQTEVRQLRRRKAQAESEQNQLKLGSKAYPKELEQARTTLQNRLYQKTGKSVAVEILADLLEIQDETWRNAVEGYLGSNKLSLLVEPKYARAAMEVYGELDREKYFWISVVDTEKVTAQKHTVLEGGLSREVSASREYARAYIDFLLGKVVKCDTVEELRNCSIGITRDCITYRSYRMQHINPVYYTKSAYIGKSSLRQRIKLLEKELASVDEKLKPQLELIKEGERILELEYLGQPLTVYEEWKHDMDTAREKAGEQKLLREKLEQMKARDIEEWERQRQQIQEGLEKSKEALRQQQRTAAGLERDIQAEKKHFLELNEALIEKEKQLPLREDLEEALGNAVKGKTYPAVRNQYLKELADMEEREKKEKNRLVDLRSSYLRQCPNRNFSPTAEDNKEYQELLDRLNFDELEEYRLRALGQARTAVEHFKDDFMYKIRSAIKEAMQRKDELNRIISHLDFGKDKYQFYIGKNKGADGKYYDMFMDEALEVDPADLNIGFDNQLNLFSTEHENHYGDMINELIGLFIPPENATAEEQEEAKRNMDKYSDYRTYLSFDMQQLIKNQDETIKIGLGRMIKKNSGGEGQNPLYVALLASFAQAYKIDLKPGIQRNPSIRLVVLDEAFSKMDGEKVASCIQLIRGLGFQAIISATNDKIQNYLETVDKVFVFANPGKRAISIQEFEKKEFAGLKQDIEEEEEKSLWQQ